MDEAQAPLPGDRQQFAHPLGKAVWAAIMALDAGVQHEILERLELHLGEALSNPEKPGRTQRAIRALRRAAELLGHSPSVKQYRLLRDETHDPELIPDSSIRSALAAGEWNECLALAGLAPSSERSRLPVVVTRSPHSYSEAECLAALRGCADDLGLVPSDTMYRRWVTRPDVRRRPGRRPLTNTPFVRHFGSFLRALEAAGVLSETVQAVKTTDLRVRPAKYAYTGEEFVAALHEVRQRLGCVPRSNRYIAVREELIAASFAAGTPRTLPSYGALLKRFGSWNEALIAAGMEPFDGRWTLGVFEAPELAACTWTDDELVEFVRKACAACQGPKTTLDDYIVWRRLEQKRVKDRGQKRKIPAKTTIASRLGGWTRAMQRVYPES